GPGRARAQGAPRRAAPGPLPGEGSPPAAGQRRPSGWCRRPSRASARPAPAPAGLFRCPPACASAAGPGQRPRGGSASAGRGLVLLYHARGDPPALTDRDAVVFRPGPDVTGALAARRGPAGPARLRAPGPAGVLDERRQLLAERRRVPLAQIDLIVRATEGEPHRLVRGAAIKIVFQRDGYSLSHLNLPNCAGCLHRTQAKVIHHSRNAADQTRVTSGGRTTVRSRYADGSPLAPLIDPLLSVIGGHRWPE